MTEALRVDTSLPNLVGATVLTTTNLQSRAEPIRVHPSGSEALVVAVIAPHTYLVEVTVPDDRLAGGAWYETFELNDDEFEERSDVS